MNFAKKIVPKLLIVSSCSYVCTKSNIFMSQSPLLSQILRGQYQNKIRRYSTPEKIFDVFATIREKGQLYMTLHDLLKAICFYNFSVSDENQASGFLPQSIIQLIGKKQKFEFYDYFILVRFLAFERKKVQKYFDQNISILGMGKEEFRKYLLEAVCADSTQFIKPSIGLQSRQFRPSLKSFEQSIDETVESVFKQRQMGFSLKSMIQFRKSLIQQLFGFQFLMFKRENGKIDGIDFARSIIKYVEASKKRKYMNRIKQLGQQFQNMKIDSEQYVGFHSYFQEHIDDLIKQLNTKGAINTQEIFELINRFVKTNNQVSKQQIEILIKVLDIDDSGFVEKKQFLGVLENLQYYTQVKSGDLTFMEMVQNDWNKIKTKSKKILEVLQQ